MAGQLEASSGGFAIESALVKEAGSCAQTIRLKGGGGAPTDGNPRKNGFSPTGAQFL